MNYLGGNHKVLGNLLRILIEHFIWTLYIFITLTIIIQYIIIVSSKPNSIFDIELSIEWSILEFLGFFLILDLTRLRKPISHTNDGFGTNTHSKTNSKLFIKRTLSSKERKKQLKQFKIQELEKRKKEFQERQRKLSTNSQTNKSINNNSFNTVFIKQVAKYQKEKKLKQTLMKEIQLKRPNKSPIHIQSSPKNNYNNISQTPYTNHTLNAPKHHIRQMKSDGLLHMTLELDPSKEHNNNNDNMLLEDNNLLVLLSNYSKLNVISFELNETNLSLNIKTNYKYTRNENKNNENAIYLLYLPKLKQYKLMSYTMNKIIESIENNDVQNWDYTQIIKWLNIIEFGLFNDKKYDIFKINISKLDINGSNISKINDLTLKSMGINDEFDIKLLIENISKLIYLTDNNNKNIIEEEEENINDTNNVITAGNIDTSNIDINIEIPESFLDPIHWNIMKDPVISIVSGHSFERQSITEWINENHTDPINQKQLELYQLVPNRTLREAIDRFLKIYGSQFTQNIQTKR